MRSSRNRLPRPAASPMRGWTFSGVSSIWHMGPPIWRDRRRARALPDRPQIAELTRFLRWQKRLRNAKRPLLPQRKTRIGIRTRISRTSLATGQEPPIDGRFDLPGLPRPGPCRVRRCGLSRVAGPRLPPTGCRDIAVPGPEPTRPGLQRCSVLPGRAVHGRPAATLSGAPGPGPSTAGLWRCSAMPPGQDFPQAEVTQARVEDVRRS
jgi:hypothetical protein